MEKLHGTLSATSATLHGILSARSVAGVEIYDGEYVVHSEAHEVQILPTAVSYTHLTLPTILRV